MKAGFTLIELVLAFAFSSILLTLLFTSFNQINRTVVTTEDLIEMNTRLNLFQNQFQKDISGAFVPVQGLPEKKEEAPKNDIEQKKEKPPTPTKDKKEKPKPLKEVFYSANKSDQLNELTFISNNPVRVYEYAKNTPPKPRIVRVVYRLIADKDKKGSYKLMRQEGTQLDFASYKPNASKPIRAFELVENIKSFNIEYQAPIPKKEEKKDEKAAQPTQAKEKEKKKRSHQNLKQKKIGALMN